MPPFGYTLVLGLPLVMWFGILTLLCLVSTATLGILVLKGRYNIPFAWHMRMAALTIVSAGIHVLLAISLYL